MHEMVIHKIRCEINFKIHVSHDYDVGFGIHRSHKGRVFFLDQLIYFNNKKLDFVMTVVCDQYKLYYEH